MNRCVHLPTGELVAMTPREAQMADGYLFESMVHAPESDHAAIQRLRDGLRPIMHPETHYDDVYTPEWYVPGWVATP